MKAGTIFGGRLDAHTNDSAEHRLEQRAAQARSHGFIEYHAKDLRKIGGYIADRSGVLFEPVLGVVLDSTGRRFEAGAVAFYVDADGADYLTDPIRFLNRPSAEKPRGRQMVRSKSPPLAAVVRSATTLTTCLLHRLYRVGAGRSRSQPVQAGTKCLL